MYAKLALRNIRRSLKDYVIYFVTLTLTASLMFSFVSLGLSEDILTLSENMSMLTSGIFGASVIVAFIASFVIGYAVRFMLSQRKREFAVYELLGMENYSIQRLFFIENSVIGLAAFLCGTLLGNVLSGLLVQLVNGIFQSPHNYRLYFSFKAMGITAVFFIAMYAFGVIRATAIIKKSKIVDLLYDSRKNESAKKRSTAFRLTATALSLISMIIGGKLLSMGFVNQTNSAIFLMGLATLFTSVGIYGVYRNVPFLLLALFRNNRKYENTNLFYLGQITGRVQSAGRLMAVTAILLTLSLCAMFIALAMGAGYKANMEVYYPYDAGISLDAPLTKESLIPIAEYANSLCPLEDYVTFYLYTVDNYPIEALSLSDYNHLRSILGLNRVALKENEFMVHCDTWNYTDEIKEALEKEPTITLNVNTPVESSQSESSQGDNSPGVIAQSAITHSAIALVPCKDPILTEAMEQYQMAGTKGYVLVLPDSVAEGLSGDKVRLILKFKDGGYSQLRQLLTDYLHSDKWNVLLQEGKALPERVTMRVTVKAWGVENSLTGFTVISFSGLYLSFIFIILSCTVLAFEMLSMLDTNRRRYLILDKMGVDKPSQKRLANREVGTFFFIPAVLPMVTTVLLIIGANRLFAEALMQKNLIAVYGIITLLLFSLVYLIYFFAANNLFKRAVLKK